MRFVVPGAPVFREGENAPSSSSRPGATAPTRSPFHAGRLPPHRHTRRRARSPSATSAGASRSTAGRAAGRSERDFERSPPGWPTAGAELRRAADYLRPVDRPDLARDRRALPPARQTAAATSAGSSSTPAAGGVGFNGAGSGDPGRDRDAFCRRWPPGTTIRDRTSTTSSSAIRRRTASRVATAATASCSAIPTTRSKAASTATQRRHAGHRRRALGRVDRQFRRRALVAHPRGRHRGAGRRRLRAQTQCGARRRDPRAKSSGIRSGSVIPAAITRLHAAGSRRRAHARRSA